MRRDLGGRRLLIGMTGEVKDGNMLVCRKGDVRLEISVCDFDIEGNEWKSAISTPALLTPTTHFTSLTAG
jgi:hypothetical protein